jgi:putative peptidoglycan lipid II flippase
MKILKSISQFSGLTFISRLFGLVRDWLFARFFGADGLMDAFLIAFKIPNFFRRLFAEGAFSQAFVPIVIGSKEKTTTLQNDGNANTTLSPTQKELVAGISARLYTTIFIFCTIGIIAAPVLISIFAPGFSDNPEQATLSADLLRITFPYLLFITVVALLSSLLNIGGRFAIGAMVPIVLNICFVLAILYASEVFNPSIKVLAVSVFIAGFLQLLILTIAAYHRGLLIMPRWRVSPQVKEQMHKMKIMLIPALLSVSVIQINLLVDMLLASTLPEGSISWLYYGQRLMELPNGIFIVAISTVILPTFSYLIKEKSPSEFSSNVDRAVLLGLFITLPSMLGLVYLDERIISMLFQGGAFENNDVSNAAKALSAYALGLPAFMLIKIYSPCFFAHHDTKTPLRCSIITVIINISLSLLLIDSLAHVGLALATSISVWANALLLYFFLIQQKKILFFQSLKELLKIFAINVLFAVALLQTPALLNEWQDWSKLQQSITLMGIIAISVMAYLLLSVLFRLNFRQWIEWKVNR